MTAGAPALSCIVHTRDSEATLARALGSVRWVADLIVVDMASQDDTVRIAREFSARILTAPRVDRVDGIRNDYIEQARHEWVLVLDADEALAADAEANIGALLDRHGADYDAFALPRFNTIAGQVMRGSGWYPDRQIRLFRKGRVRWSDAIHKRPAVAGGRTRLLEVPPEEGVFIHHRNYDDLRQFIARQLDYALKDRYPSDPSSFQFGDYVALAYRHLATRRDPEKDGDLSHALALVMAWDAIVRGLLHWEALAPRPGLGAWAALPIATSRMPRWKVALRRWLLRALPLRATARRLARRARSLVRLSR
jgi:glycosyltransferase involved in cell wall biosynthesis